MLWVTEEEWEGLAFNQSVESRWLSSQAASHLVTHWPIAMCFSGGKKKTLRILVELKCNNASCHAVRTTIYGIIKVNVMALDFAAYNLPFNWNRDSSVSKRKLDNLIFISIHVQACVGAHPCFLLCDLKYGRVVWYKQYLKLTSTT